EKFRQGEPALLAPAQGGDRLEDVVAPEEEAREETAGLLDELAPLLENLVEDRAGRVEADAALHVVRQPNGPSEMNGAPEALQRAGDRAQQGALPGAVGSGDADPRSPLDFEAEPGEEHLCPVAEAHRVESDDAPLAPPARAHAKARRLRLRRRR